MIRAYRDQDFKEILDIVKRIGATDCAWLTTVEAVRRELEEAEVAFVDDIGEIRGFVYKDPVTVHSKGKRIHFYLFVDPDYRDTDVADHLYEAISEHLDEDAYRISLAYPEDLIENRQLAEKHGFSEYFRSHRMTYWGTVFDCRGLSWRKYEDKDFDEYMRIVAEGFEDLRRQYDMVPYKLFSEEGFDQLKMREELLEDKEDIIVFMADSQYVGFAVLSDFIDSMVVDPVLQGKGYGREMVKCCVEIMLERGRESVSLYVIEGNERAIDLYRSLGFKTDRVIEVMAR